MRVLHLLTSGVLMLSLAAGGALAQTDKAKKQAEIRKVTQSSLDKFYKANPKLKAEVAKAPGYAVFTTYGFSFLIGGAGGSGLTHDNKTKKST
jgi:lipid-binding SYLF domain-containing protein